MREKTCCLLGSSFLARLVEPLTSNCCLSLLAWLDRATHARWVEQPSRGPKPRALPSLRHPKSSPSITSSSEPNLTTPYPMAHPTPLSSVQDMAWATRCSKSSSIRWELALDSTCINHEFRSRHAKSKVRASWWWKWSCTSNPLN